jgi:caa(3)-type oxidase subunit IV
MAMESFAQQRQYRNPINRKEYWSDAAPSAATDLGPFNVITALVIAVVKMLLVALFFMHMRYSTRLMRIVVAGGLLWLGILFLLTMADYVTRGWLGVPGK